MKATQPSPKQRDDDEEKGGREGGRKRVREPAARRAEPTSARETDPGPTPRVPRGRRSLYLLPRPERPERGPERWVPGGDAG